MSIFSKILADATALFTHFNQANYDQLIADIQQGVQVAESDLAAAAAWVAANGPTYVQDAETLVSVLAALTGNLTIPASVIAALQTAISDMEQFIAAVSNASSGTTSAFDVFATMGAVDDQSRVALGYKMNQSLIQATATARNALAVATKK
jgi:hypothetical protein